MSFSGPLNNYAHASADQPRIATFARMRSGWHLFSGIGQLIHIEENNHCVHFFPFLITYSLHRALLGSRKVSSAGEPRWIQHWEDVCKDELLQRSDGWAGSRAAAVRSGDGRIQPGLAQPSLYSQHTFPGPHTWTVKLVFLHRESYFSSSYMWRHKGLLKWEQIARQKAT